MVEIERLQDMAAGGLDATALTYEENGETIFYVYLGGSKDVVRYNADTQTSTIDHQSPFDAINKKIIQPDGKNDTGIMSSMKGTDSSTYYKGDIITCDPQNQNYSKIGNIGVYRNNPMTVVKNGTIYCWGGTASDGTGASTEMWDLNTVSKVGDLNVGLAESCVGVLSDGTVINAGGNDPHMNEVWEIDVTAPSATKLATLTEPDGTSPGWNRAFGGAVGDSLFVFGASVNDTGFSDKLRKVAPYTGETEYAEIIPTPIRNTIIGFDGDVLYSFGGKTDTGNTTLAYRVSGLSNKILLLSDGMGLRGGVPSASDEVVIHTDGLGRVEKTDSVDDPVAILEDGVGQS